MTRGWKGEGETKRGRRGGGDRGRNTGRETLTQGRRVRKCSGERMGRGGREVGRKRGRKRHTILAASSRLSTPRIFIGLVAMRAFASSTLVPADRQRLAEC